MAEELTIRAQSIFYETTRLEEELRSVEEEGARGVVDKARVEKEATEMQASIDAAKAEGGKTSAWIEANRASAEVLTQEKVDALTNSEDALERQHTAVMAADTALSDLIYALDKALKDGKVDLDTYLKLVRKYAAEQYNVRALAAKVEQALRQ